MPMGRADKDVQNQNQNLEYSIHVFPIGNGFLTKEETATLTSIHECEKIQAVQGQFRRMVLGKVANATSRRSRDERLFVCKAQFILQHEHEHCWEHFLIDLLADQTTLFSRNYQIYAADHPAYLNLRRQQGSNSKEQLRLCMNKALSKAPNKEKRRYENILLLIVKKAGQDAKPLTELEQDIINAVVDWKITSRELKEFLSWAKENVKVDEILNAVKKLLPNWEVTRQEADYLLQGCLQENGRTGMGLFHFYRKLCTYFTSYGEARVVNWLNHWNPDLKLRNEDAQPFVSDVLETFFASIMALPLEKEAAGHYKARYREFDKNACLAYQKRKERIERALKKYQEGRVEEKLIKESELPDPIVDLIGTSSKKSQIDVKEDKIAEDTREYLSFTRGGAKHFDVDLAKEAVRQTAVAADNKIECFPMLYLMVCVAGSSQLFETCRSLGKESLQGAFEIPYHQKPARWRQRIHRIDFLHKLHKLCELDRDQRSASWQWFLQIHGSAIESAEEADLWRMIIYDDNEGIDFDNPKEDISPIELSLLCNDCLQTCLPIQLEYLFGYQGGSVLHMGGFAQFLQKYPDVLPACVQRIKQRPDRWKDIQKQYLKQWSMIPCDLLEIKEQCRQGCELIRWGTLPNISREDIYEFFKSLPKNKVGKKRIMSDIEELKILLIESALRITLNEQARGVLAHKIEETWNKDSDFEIRVSFVKREVKQKRKGDNN